MPLAVRNQGTAPLTIVDAVLDDPAFSVEPRTMRVAAGETATFTLGYEPKSPEKGTALLQFSTDNPDNPTRQGYLVGNQPGIGVGKPFPDASAALVDGGRWASTGIPRPCGRARVLRHFLTGVQSGVARHRTAVLAQVPRPRPEGRGIESGRTRRDPGAAATDDIAGVQRFTDKLGVTFPAGVEETGSYLRFAENFRGANPFPIDVIVDRDGTIAYVARGTIPRRWKP